MIYIHIATQDISVTDAIQRVSNPAHGAIDLFIGTVRNNHNGQDVTGITYDVHEPIATATLTRICREATGLWPSTHYAVIHYKGELSVGGTSIVIAVSAPHRAESFEACRYIIEEIKKQAPVWKQEHYRDGKSAWLPGHSLRQDSAQTDTCCGKCGGAHHG